jgi:WD40 repeat protein
MIFDLGVGWPSKELKDGHKYDIDCVQFSPNEKLVASFSFKDKKLVIWKVNKKIKLFNFL